MPFAHIHLLAGHPPAWLDSVSAQVQRALEESFETPTNDCFQVFHQYQPGEFRFHPTYLGGPRSDNYLLIHIFTGKTRRPAVKYAFFKKLVELLGDQPGIAPQDVMIIINNTEIDDWSFSHGDAAARRETS